MWPPDLSRLTEADKDAPIVLLWTQVEPLTTRVAALEAKLTEPAKTADNSSVPLQMFRSSVPPSVGPKARRPDTAKRDGPRRGSLGRTGGGRPLAKEPDQVVIATAAAATAAACVHCRGRLSDADQRLHARDDKIDLPPVRPVVTRVERYVGRCPGCGGATLAPVPDGLEHGTPFRRSLLACALSLRFVHALSARRLTRLFRHRFALESSEGALDALFRRAKPRFGDEVAALLARLRRAVAAPKACRGRASGRARRHSRDHTIPHLTAKRRPACRPPGRGLCCAHRRAGPPHFGHPRNAHPIQLGRKPL